MHSITVEPMLDMFSYIGVYFPESNKGKSISSLPKYPGLDRREFIWSDDEPMYLYVRVKNIYALVYTSQSQTERFIEDWKLGNLAGFFNFEWLFPERFNVLGNKFVIATWSVFLGDKIPQNIQSAIQMHYKRMQ